MNILIFVMTMLMLLSLMTYARLESYRSSQAFQIIFKHYMEESERSYINQGAEGAYARIQIPKQEESQEGKQKKDKETKPKKTAGTSPKIGIKLLLDPKRDGQSKEWAQTQILLKNLMRNLYKEHPFYTDVEKEHPSLLDELIRETTRTIDLLPPDKRPKTAKDLGNLELPDPVLDSLLYKMLHGALYSNNFSKETPPEYTLKEETEEPKGEATEDEENPGDETEFHSPEGYYSLLDFITEKHTPKVRIYLASQEVLQAIFPDRDTVAAIMAEREQLHKRALAGEDVNELDETFKNQFLRLKDPEIDDESLNFSVSKTNPKYYR